MQPRDMSLIEDTKRIAQYLESDDSAVRQQVTIVPSSTRSHALHATRGHAQLPLSASITCRVVGVAVGAAGGYCHCGA